MRLEISLRPFRFQARDHNMASAISLLLIMGIPAMETLIWLLVQGYVCDCETLLLVMGLYEGQELVPSLTS